MPDLGLESATDEVVTGIDEAGRGPWAGPVLAAAVILDRRAVPAGLNDSKKLAKPVRERLYEELTATAGIGIGMADVAEIDRYNILGASLLAMRRAALALPQPPTLALVDGNRLPTLSCRAVAVVGGDGRSASIAAASIIAKVVRDRLMVDLAARYPGYGWERNAGYGTPEHRAALARLGVSPEHRRSFAPIRALTATDDLLTD